MFSNLARQVRRAFQQRRGAVTIDFVVLTASVIIMFMLVIEPVYRGSTSLVNQISERMLAHALSTSVD
jgi:predicted PurR-regulated permease PerM